MEIYSWLSDCLARIGASSSLPLLWSGVKDFAGRLGYSHLLAVDLAKFAGGSREAVLYSDAPPELFAAIVSERIFDRHPVVLRILQSYVPFLVSDVSRQPEHIGRRWTELFVDVVKNGEGLVVPVYWGEEPKFALNFGGEKPDTTPMARSMLQVVAHAAIDKMRELGSGKSAKAAPSLSVRETQCLRLVAVGQTDADVGQILGISPRTVRFHVDSAKTKLGVTTRIQAVAKALRDRVIAV